MAFKPYTSVELTAIGEVLAHQRTFSPLTTGVQATRPQTELHIAVDGTGSAEISRQIHPASGGEMNEAMKAAAASGIGCRIFHNHPTEGSLSASDWNVLASHPAMEMTAVNSRGTTFRGSVVTAEAFPSWFAVVGQAEAAVSDLWERMVGEFYGNGDFHRGDLAQANGWLVTFGIAERLLDLGCVEFETNLAGSDIAVMSHQLAAGILVSLRTWCAAAIP